MDDGLKSDVTPYDAKVSQVCVPCNGGWMRLMDEAIKPLVFQLALGKMDVIPSAQVLDLSIWCTKVALLQTHSNRAAEQEVAPLLTRKFFSDKTPILPRMVQVGWAENEESSIAGNLSRQRRRGGRLAADKVIPGPILDTANVVIFKIGAFVFVVGLPSSTSWSAREIKAILSANRIHFSEKLVPLDPTLDFKMPQASISDRDVLSMREIMYRAASRSARLENAHTLARGSSFMSGSARMRPYA